MCRRRTSSRGHERPAARENARDDAIAALASEVEDVAGFHVEFARKRLSQHSPCAEHARPYGRFRDRQARRGLVDRQLLDFPQNKHSAKRHRQLVDFLLEQAPDVCPRHALDEARERAAQFGIRDDRPKVLEHWHDAGSWLAPPVMVSGEVLGTNIGYELLVGVTRLGNLLGALDRQDVAEGQTHLVWTGRPMLEA